ncbi:hypothetical protein Tco_1381596 [Tanacetum coccineum]
MGAMAEYRRVRSKIKVDENVNVMEGELECHVFGIVYNNSIIEACEAVTTKRFGGSGHEAFGGYDQKPLKAAIKSLWRL